MKVPLKDKAWMAGFFDGEGCISIRSTKKQPLPSSLITICNTKEDSIKVFQYYFGGKIHYRTFKTPGKNKKPEYRWNCPKATDIEFITIIFPFLVIKRVQAKLFLDFQKTLVRGSGRSRKVSDENRMLRYGIYGKMKLLNAKGVVLN